MGGWLLGFLLVAPGSTMARAQTNAAAGDIADLKRQIAILMERVQALEKQAGTPAAPAPAPAPPATPTPAPAPAAPAGPAPVATADTTAKPGGGSPRVALGAGGLAVTSTDTNFAFRIRGYLQTDARAYASDRVDPAAEDTFLIRRARPILEGTTFGWLDYRLMLDFGSQASLSTANNALLQDAYATARFSPGLQLQAGKFKEPVGLERSQSGANLLFIERAFPTQLVPNRDVGVQLQGDVVGGRLRYEAGVFNGVTDAGSGDFDTTDNDKDLAGRLFVHPFKKTAVPALQGLGLGVAGTAGSQEGSLRAFTSTGFQRFFSYRSATDPTRPNVLADGARWRVVPQATYYVGPFGLLAEYAVSSTLVRQAGGGAGAGSSDRLEHTGWQVAASYFVTGERNGFKAVSPAHPVTLADGGGWGAVELAARISGLELDPESFPIYANPAVAAREALAFGVGANWHLNRNLKLSLNYERTTFEAEAGNPYGDAAEDLFLVRAQVAF